MQKTKTLVDQLQRSRSDMEEAGRQAKEILSTATDRCLRQAEEAKSLSTRLADIEHLSEPEERMKALLALKRKYTH